ncbi:MAG: transposase [Anaerolineae bacterium]
MSLFGCVVDGEMRLNDAGRVAEQCWLDIPAHFPHVQLDAFVIMPNHVHGILWIVGNGNNVGAKNFLPLRLPRRPPSLPPRGTSKTIGSVVRGFKIGVIKWFRQNTSVYAIWQRNYYEHIIRDDLALGAIRSYIAENPLRWHLDQYNPDATGPDPLAVDLWKMLKGPSASPDRESMHNQNCEVHT